MSSYIAQDGSLLGPLRSKKFVAICVNFTLILFGTYSVLPFISLYAASLVSISGAGIAVASLTLAAVLVDTPTGILVESIGTRKLMLGGAIACTAGGSVASFVATFPALLVGVFLIGAGQAMIMVSNWIAVGQIAPGGKRGLYTTYYLLITSVGIVLGSVAGGFIIDALGIRAPFYLETLVAGASLCITYFAIHETDLNSATRPSLGEIGQVFKSMLHTQTLLINLGWLVFGIVSLGVINTAFPLQSKILLGLDAAQIGFAIAVSRATGLVSFAVSGPLYDRYSGKWLYAIGFFAVAVSMITLGASRNFIQVIIVMAAFGFASSLISSSQIIFGVDTPTNVRRATWIGVYRVFGDIGMFIGPLIVAEMIRTVGFNGMFEFVFLLSALYSIILILGLKGRTRRLVKVV